MQSSIIYLHGFQGSSSSRTAVALKTVFGSTINCLDYDFINPTNAISQIEAVLQSLFKSNEDIILVGTSLGGFFANYFSEKYGLKAILINPSLNPQKTFPAYLGQVEGLTQELIDSYAAFPMKDTRTIYKDVFSGENDTVVPTAMVREILNSHTVTVLEGEGHRIENVAPIVDAINQAINNFS